jgi:hypothetical protein
MYNQTLRNVQNSSLYSLALPALVTVELRNPALIVGLRQVKEDCSLLLQGIICHHQQPKWSKSTSLRRSSFTTIYRVVEITRIVNIHFGHVRILERDLYIQLHMRNHRD